MTPDVLSPGFTDIVPIDAELERISTGHIFTEGPVWNTREGSLYWTDIIGNTIWKWTPGVGRSVVLRPTGKANGMTFDCEGRLIVAGWGSRSVWRMNLDGSIIPLSTHYEGKKLNTPNDVVVKSDGAIYFTDPAGALSIIGMGSEDLQQYIDFDGVYRLEPDTGRLLLLTEVEGCNGLMFSPDESLLYVNNGRGRDIMVFDVQSDGTVTNMRVFAHLAGDDPGNADGMKVDAQGNVYAAGPGGFHVLDPQGNLLGRVLLPEHCSNLAWGGDDWRDLYITARRSVYRLRLNVQGVPV